MNLVCPNCDNHWKFRGKAKRVQCPKCKRFFSRNLQKPAETCNIPAVIEDKIMRGNILEVLESENIDPMNNKELFKDTIPLLLKEPDIKFAFAKACEKRKKSPEKLLRSIVKKWLKQEKLL